MPELQFRGKEFVYNHHLTVPFRPLEMHSSKSVGDTRLGGNLIVHGDNLHALKALLPMYASNVDCIFIDPPYNTGNEGWAYNDNVNSPMIREWLNDNPIGLEDGLRHDKWACMMWPRLKLLKELLTQDGLLFATIDYNEQHRFRLLLDEIFGEKGFVAEIAWQKSYSPSNDAGGIDSLHDSILVYSNISKPNIELFERTQKQDSAYKNLDNDPRGPWKPGDSTRAEHRDYAFYPITTPSGKVVYPAEGRSWAFRQEEVPSLIEKGLLYFGVKGDAKPSIKQFIVNVQSGLTPTTWWPHQEAGHNDKAKKEIKSIFSDSLPFATPKPLALLSRIVALIGNPNALFLDSFAGSGTTAHAVLAANVRDGGNRRFILVEGEDYADTLTAERVRRVINGYAFNGKQREELLREPITFSKLKNANTLLEKVQAIETLDGPKFDRISTKVKDGALIVTGERDVVETTPGLGGSFTYCTLGAPIEMDAILSGEGLPDLTAMASLLWHTATASPFAEGDMEPASHQIGDGLHNLGVFSGRTYWLIYKPDRDWLKTADAALSLAKARAIAASAPGNHLVFAPAKFVSRELLARERLDVDYAPLPFALYRLETA